MLKVDLYKYKKNIFKEIGNRSAILTAGGYNDFNGMTVSWGGVGVLWNMNVAFVFVRKSRHTYKFTEKYDSFTLSFLPKQYQEAYKIFGTLSGKDIDKFEKTGLHPSFEPDFNGYFIAEADYVFRLKKLCAIPFEEYQDQISSFYPNGDYHTVYICKIVDLLVEEEYDVEK